MQDVLATRMSKLFAVLLTCYIFLCHYFDR